MDGTHQKGRDPQGSELDDSWADIEAQVLWNDILRSRNPKYYTELPTYTSDTGYDSWEDLMNDEDYLDYRKGLYQTGGRDWYEDLVNSKQEALELEYDEKVGPYDGATPDGSILGDLVGDRIK